MIGIEHARSLKNRMIDNLDIKDKRFIDFQVITEPEFIETVGTPPEESDSDSGVIEVQSVQVDEQVNEKATMLVDVDVGGHHGWFLFI